METSQQKSKGVVKSHLGFFVSVKKVAAVYVAAQIIYTKPVL
jgi:hypothetical protein